MRRIALIARRALEYGGRALGAGDVFDATPIDAAILTYRHHAAFAPTGVTASPAPSSVAVVVVAPSAEEDPPKPKRRYRRKDLIADEE